MNIIYGVSGEGLGHVFEALEIIPYIQRHGHKVKVFTYGERASALLAPYDVTRIEGISLEFNTNGLSFSATVRKNLKCVPFFFKNWRKLKKEIADFKPDAFITAFDPFSTYAAHAFRKPLISMDNQARVV